MKTIATAAMILTAGLFGTSASAADPHLDDLAFSLKKQAAAACQEVRYGFRRTAVYPQLYKDFYELYTLADHVHDVAHNHGDLCHLKDDVDDMDRLFHHAEEMVARFSVPQTVLRGRACLTPQATGVSTYHLRRLNAILATMEDTIHHIQDDLDAELNPGGLTPPLPPGQFAPPAPNNPNIPILPPQPTGVNHGFSPREFPQSRSIGIRSRNGKVAFTVHLGR